MAEAYQKAINKGVENIRSSLSIQAHDAFMFWFATTILDASENEALDGISVEGANDKGIDFFWVDENEQRVVIAQAKYSPSFDPRIKERDVDVVIGSLDWLASPEALRRESRHDLAQAAEDYIEAIKKNYPVELWFIYNGPKKENIEKKIQVYNSNPENRERNRYFRHYHSQLLRDLWAEIEGTASRVPEESIEIIDDDWIAYSGTFGDALLTSVPANELRRLNQSYGDRLFDRNVRLYLGARAGSVNAGILETLESSADRNNFWAYNNGITIICDDFVKEEGSNKVTVKNFSVINGCQTTVSLAQSSSDIDEVSVLCRIIAAQSEIVDNIILYNNSQNPIKTWDIASQDRTQRRLKSELEHLKKPYIYMTRRGARPKSDIKKFRDSSGRLRQIRIDEAGQYATAFQGSPVIAYKEKGLIFSKYRDEFFPPDSNVLDVLFQWICGDVCSECVKVHIRTGPDNEVRILKRGGALFVTGVMGYLIELRNGATYGSKMTEETVSSEKMKKRLNNYAKYSVSTYLSIVQDLIEIENVEITTVLRSPDFFDRVTARVRRDFERQSLGAKWMDEALPKLFQ